MQKYKNFVYINNTLAVQSTWLFDDAEIMTASYYRDLVSRGQMKKIQRGGNGRKALVDYNSIPQRFKDKIELIIGGDPLLKFRKSRLEKFIVRDPEAFKFYKEYRKPNGSPLAADKREAYAWNACIYKAIHTCYTRSAEFRKQRGGALHGLWDNVVKMVNNLDPEKYPHSISGHPRTIRRNMKKFRKEGFLSVIPGTVGNSNSAKIEGEVADWIVAQYSLPIKLTIPEVSDKYAFKQQSMEDWPLLSESGIHYFLNKPDNRRLWFLARHGKDAWATEYGHHMKRDREQWFPNSYWAIDGTKLDWIHYKDTSSNKMGAELRIDVNFDIFSEKILGYSMSDTESHVDHFKAMKMSIDVAGSQPYLLTYDKQAAHMSSKMQKLYDNIIAQGGTHYSHKVGRKSSPVEQIFNRFQQQVISKFWFSDKQSITVVHQDNKPNLDFIKEHKHHMKSKEELTAAWETAIKNWNDMEHPRFPGKTRSEVYEMEAPYSHEVNELDAMEIFWIEQNKGSTYTKGGISIIVDHEKYEYEVYTDDDKVDKEFRKYNIGKKFIIKYDPTSMDLYVGLYEEDVCGDLSFVAYARPKHVHETIPILMKEGDKERLNADMRIRDEELEDAMRELDRIRKSTGITPEKLIEDQELMIKQRGMLHKEENIEVEKSIFEKL